MIGKLKYSIAYNVGGWGGGFVIERASLNTTNMSMYISSSNLLNITLNAYYSLHVW